MGLARGATQSATGSGAYTTAPAGTTGVGSNAANPNGYGAPNGYIGGLADTISTLTHLGARDLDPVLGTFTSPDPLLKPDVANNFSPYVYGEADAINNADPSGLMVMGPALTDGDGGWYGHGAVDSRWEDSHPFNDYFLPWKPIAYQRSYVPVVPAYHPVVATPEPEVIDADETMAYIRKNGLKASSATAVRYLSFDASFVPGVGGLSAVGLDMWANSIEGKPAVDEGDGLYMAMTLGAGPLGKLGKLGKVGASAARTGEVAAGAAIHGNSASSPAVTYLYRLYHEDGTYLKTGVSKNPFNRYSRSFMEDKSMEVLQSGNRREMLNLERFIVERDPGPLNLERWAGAFRTDVP
jgi:RHS repeat-associated protein